jgi:hypothetical protein
MSITNIQVCVRLLARWENHIDVFGLNGRTLPNREDIQCDSKRNNTCMLLMDTWFFFKVFFYGLDTRDLGVYVIKWIDSFRFG